MNHKGGQVIPIDIEHGLIGTWAVIDIDRYNRQSVSLVNIMFR